MLNKTTKVNTPKRMIIIVGPSGSGKSAVQKHLARKGYRPMVSTTTRLIRDKEIDGVDYNFTTKDKFDSMVKDGLFIEHVEFAGKQYGLEKSEVDKQPGDVSVIVEPKGACDILDYCKTRDDLSYSLVFINVSKESQVKNMGKRGDSSEAIKARLASDNIASEFKRLGLLKIANTILNSDEHTINSMTEAILDDIMFLSEVQNGR